MSITVSIQRKFVSSSKVVSGIDNVIKVSQGYGSPMNVENGIHREMNRLRAETSYNVSITFNAPFKTIPIGIKNLKVYRMVELEAGKWGMQDVLFTYPSEEDWLTETGFEINIDPIESLVGIWIEYNFTE